jgi:hypothetical protein
LFDLNFYINVGRAEWERDFDIGGDIVFRRQITVAPLGPK